MLLNIATLYVATIENLRKLKRNFVKECISLVKIVNLVNARVFQILMR